MRKTLTDDSKFRKFIAYFWIVLIGLVLFLPNYLSIPYLNLNKSCPLYPFCSSISTPWGAFTSLFVFDGWTNLYAFILWFMFLLLITVSMSADLVEKYTKFIVMALFPLSIFSNAVGWVILAVQGLATPYAGASTFTYVFLGLLFGLSTPVLIQNFRKMGLKNLVTNPVFLINLVFVITAVYYIASTLLTSFSIPHTDYVHEVSFLIGVVSIIAYVRN